MINAISAADIAFIMSISTSAWLLSHLECSSQKQNGWTLRFCFWGWIMWKIYNKTIIEFGFRMISWITKTSWLCYLPQPSASADNTDLGFDNSWYHAQTHPIIVYNYYQVKQNVANVHNSLLMMPFCNLVLNCSYNLSVWYDIQITSNLFFLQLLWRQVQKVRTKE